MYDNLVIPSSEIHSTTSFPGTLQHTDFYNRGNLTFITNKCYLVFINLEQCVENLLQKSFLLQSGRRFVTDVVKELLSNQALKQSFIDLFHEEDISNNAEGQTENNAVSSNNIVQLDSTTITNEFEDIHSEDEDISDLPIDFAESPYFNDDDHFPDSFSGSSAGEKEADDQCSEPEILVTELSDSALNTVFSESDDATVTDSQDCLSSLFEITVKKYFMCRAKQFIKSVKNDLEVEKTKAHWKNRVATFLGN